MSKYLLYFSVVMMLFSRLSYGEEFVAKELVVKAKDTKIIKELSQGLDVDIERVFKSVNDKIYRIRFSKDVDIHLIADRYMSSSDIEYVHPNYILDATIIPNDEYFEEQWAIAKITAPAAWDIERGTSAVIIALPDTGVDLDHPDLSFNIWVNDDKIDGVDNDNNGYIDDNMGWDFVNKDNLPQDDNGHGTAISGVIAGMTNNGRGIAGVSWYCKIMPIKCLDKQGRGNVIDISRAIEYAVDNGARIINMSFGSYEDIPLLKEAIDYAYRNGCVLVASAGNDNTTAMFYPAGYGSVTSVCAVDNDDKKLSFSNYGHWIDVSAPGKNILTTTWDNSYSYVDGTSIASGFVSGLAGLIISKYPTWINDKIYQKIIATTDNIDQLNPGYEGLLGSGRINLYKSIVGPRINISPTSGTIGSMVTIRGENFGEIEPIRIDFGTTLTIGLTTTEANGSFTATFKVDSQPYGLTTITATGLLSKDRAYAIFNIKPDFVIIRGKVVDSMSNQPIRKAVIEIIQNKRVKFTATTDNEGNYRIENIPAGMYHIRAKKEIVHRWRQIIWRRLVYIPHTKYQVEVNTVDNEVTFYLSKAYHVEWAHIEEGNEINTNENKNMDVRIKVNYDPKYWFYLYPKDASSYEIKDFSRESIGLNGCWSNRGRWYDIDWDDGTYIDKKNNRLHIKVWISGYWWRRAYFNYRYTIDCQLKGSSNKDKNSPIVAFEPEENKTPKMGRVKLAINRIKLQQQGANPLPEEKNVLSIMIKDVEDTLTTAKITLKFNPDKVKIEDIKSPVLPDAGLKVFVGGKIDNDKGSVQVEALVVDEDLLMGTYTDIVDKTTGHPPQQVATNRDTSDIQEENIAPIAHIIIEPRKTKGAKGLTLDDMLSYIEIDGIELRNAQGEEIPINIEDKPTEPTYASDLRDAYCYPNPTNKCEITFAKLTKQVKVRIFNIAGELVYGEYEHEADGNAEWRWGCKNNAGEKVASGIYIYILKDPVSGSMKRGKIGVVR